MNSLFVVSVIASDPDLSGERGNLFACLSLMRLLRRSPDESGGTPRNDILGQPQR